MRTRRLQTLLFALWIVVALPLPASAEPDLSSPQAVFESFLGAMVDAKQGQTARLDDAVACLDLSDASVLVRREGRKLARDLKTYLDKVERIDIASLPVDVDGTRWVYARSRDGEVSVVLKDDGRWLFSRETVDSIPSLLSSVRDQEFAEGIDGGGGMPATFADWLRERFPESLRARAFVLENWQWIALLFLAFVGVILDRLVRVVLGVWLSRLLAKSDRFREKGLDESFEKPVGILVMALAWWLMLPLLDLPLQALTALKFASRVVMAVAGVWGIYRLVDVVSAHFAALAARTESKLDDILIPMARRAVKIVALAFLVLFVAQNLNVDITSLLAGLGIGGIAFALAAKDTVENLFGSVTVLVDRPFQTGDWVVIGDQEGTVEEIGFRSTRLRTFHNSLITMPNSLLVKSAVDNLGARRYRRLKCMIAIEYGTPPDRIEAFCEGIRELIRKHPYTRKDYYMVYLNQFADSSLNVLLYTFHETPDWPTELRERHRLFLDIVRLAHRLGVGFAFPTQTLHLASAPPGIFPSAEAATDAGGKAPTVGQEQAIRLGREEAERIMQEMWGEGPQPPVTFSDPERIRPAAGPGSKGDA